MLWGKLGEQSNYRVGEVMNILKLSAVSLLLLLLLISCGGYSETKTPDPTTQDNEVASQSPTITTSPTPEPTEPAQSSPSPTPSPSPSPRTETYTEMEAYEEVITSVVTVDVIYDVEKYINPTFMEQQNTMQFGDMVSTSTELVQMDEGCLKITNMDDTGGVFKVKIDVGGFFPCEKEIEIEPGETVDTCCPAFDTIGHWTYKITPPTKEIEKETVEMRYREVEKTRIVYD